MVGEVEVKERPRPSPDYLMQLLNEKKLMTSLPNLCGIFTHLERLLDEGKRWLLRLVGRSVTAARRGAAGSGPGTASLGDPARTTTSYTPRRHCPSQTFYQFVLPVAYLTATRTPVLASLSVSKPS